MYDLWLLQHVDPGTGLSAGCATPEYDDSDWQSVQVPGDVHRTLIDKGEIPDPFYDQSESTCAWMEEQEWWYRLHFEAPAEPPQAGERLQLVFQGVDTFATVWLNGEKLGRTRNMFHPWTFDVTAQLRYGETNILAVCFDPPLHHVDTARLPEFSAWGHNAERVFMRKAQFGYGWDWGPRLPTIGLWRAVELRCERKAAITGVHFYTLEINQAEDQALVAVRVELDRFASEDPLTVHIRLEGDSVVEQTCIVEKDTVTAYLTVNSPRLWWTHDLGEPYLYALTVSLSHAGDELAAVTQQVGIRTLELDQSVDTAEPGTRFFRFVLNGVPVFARGADWIPADSFVGTIPDEQYEKLLTMARDGNMTMLRVWGGGIYEHDLFYALCDRLGIMVWQDFMFACAMYPEYDPAFVDSVRTEATYQVRRLRNHPCLALWCGNNENQWIHEQVNWDKGYQQVPGALYYHDIIPEVVAQEDSQTPYWPGSPYGGNDHASMDDGNRHNWEVWHGNGYHRHFGDKPSHDISPAGVSYLRYAEDRGRFISEFGMHAAPVHETLRRSIPSDQLYHHSPAMDHHNKDNPKNKGDNLMLTVTGLPDTLDDYVDFSMIAQAEGLKFGVEHFRRRKPHCSGTLIWQFNDCWPVLSWSMVDYYGFGKASYYTIRRSYAPVLASFKPSSEDSIELWLTNDALQPVVDTAIVTLRKFTGEVLHEERLSLNVPANHSQMIACWPDLNTGADRYLSVHSEQGTFEANRHFFGMIKDLERQPQPVTASTTAVSPHELHVTVKAEQFAYFVHLDVPHLGTGFSDNYFDLEPGETRTVIVRNTQTQLTSEDVTIRWR